MAHLFSAMPEAFCSSMRLARSTMTAAASTGGVPARWMLEMQVRSASTVCEVGL
uniref:hypothetical protein n=1 Tax=Thauera sp. SDU_THAU2 TaxID=3136633 RepID=UPI00311E9E71